MEVTAEHVEAARDLVIAFLKPLESRDWSVPAPDLEWDCERTLQHIINTEIYYAMLLADWDCVAPTRSERRGLIIS